MSSSNKRERDLARAKYERQQQRRAERQQKGRRRNQIIAVVAALAVVLGGVVALVLTNRSGDEVADGSISPTPSASSSTSVSPSASPSTSTSASASASPTASVKGCTKAPTPTVKTKTWASPPADTRPAGTQSTLTLATNCGDITIQMVPNEKAPQTTTSMVFLAQQGFYTDSDCFRLTTEGIFVLQCGSPNNDGTGGPGYDLPDENLPAAGGVTYPKGTVAMANAGAGTSGSQFFIVYKDTTLDPKYTIWGTVVSGLDIVEKIGAAGVTPGSANMSDGTPAQPIVITKATTSDTPAG